MTKLVIAYDPRYVGAYPDGKFEEVAEKFVRAWHSANAKLNTLKEPLVYSPFIQVERTSNWGIITFVRAMAAEGLMPTEALFVLYEGKEYAVDERGHFTNNDMNFQITDSTETAYWRLVDAGLEIDGYANPNLRRD